MVEEAQQLASWCAHVLVTPPKLGCGMQEESAQSGANGAKCERRHQVQSTTILAQNSQRRVTDGIYHPGPHALW